MSIGQAVIAVRNISYDLYTVSKGDVGKVVRETHNYLINWCDEFEGVARLNTDFHFLPMDSPEEQPMACSTCQHYIVCSFRKGYDQLRASHLGLLRLNNTVEDAIALSCLEYLAGESDA